MPLEKYKKECDIVKVTLVQGFCSLKITITQFWKSIWLRAKGKISKRMSNCLFVYSKNPRIRS